MAKIPKSIKLDPETIAVIDALLNNVENLKLKTKYNPMIEHLIETNPEFVAQKKIHDLIGKSETKDRLKRSKNILAKKKKK